MWKDAAIATSKNQKFQSQAKTRAVKHRQLSAHIDHQSIHTSIVKFGNLLPHNRNTYGKRLANERVVEFIKLTTPSLPYAPLFPKPPNVPQKTHYPEESPSLASPPSPSSPSASTSSNSSHASSPSTPTPSATSPKLCSKKEPSVPTLAPQKISPHSPNQYFTQSLRATPLCGSPNTLK